ncbi:MAG: hypothetical protein JW891_04370 [Candidatus Lokiarchaeota archaeon]|nr:hypothetical protein [Candidatus Lokiarchaeota archaeon]
MKKLTRGKIGLKIYRAKAKNGRVIATLSIFFVVIICAGLFPIPLFSNNALQAEERELVVEDRSLLGRKTLFFDNIESIFSSLTSEMGDSNEGKSLYSETHVKVLFREDALNVLVSLLESLLGVRLC